VIPEGTMMMRKGGEKVEYKSDPLSEIEPGAVFQVSMKISAPEMPGEYKTMF
jgi:hypothetical protein